jgi:hypothetical protein
MPYTSSALTDVTKEILIIFGLLERDNLELSRITPISDEPIAREPFCCYGVWNTRHLRVPVGTYGTTSTMM